ncbi:MAG: hypothetical protein WBA73_03785 [Devosia sp.]
MTTFETADRKAAKKAPHYFAWSAYAVPVLILTGFGLVTTLPIVLLSYGVIRDGRVRALRWWVALTTGLFAIPFVGWLFRADPEASLSSMLHPTMAGAIVLSALVLIAKIIKSHRG